MPPEESEAEPAPAVAVPAPAAASAATGGEVAALDDLSAWGLADAGAGGDRSGAAVSAGGSDDDKFLMDSMLAAAQGGIALPTSPPLAPVDDWHELDGTAPAREGGEAAARNRKPGARLRLWLRGRSAPALPSAILVLVAVLAALLGWRADVVRVLPQTASLYAAIGLPVNLRGLAFEDVKTSREIQDGVPVLVVEGRIVNVSKLMLEVPRIRFALRSQTGNEVYNWTTLPTRPVLSPNAEQTFRTRLASPPGEGREVMVRFFSRRDLLGGMR